MSNITETVPKSEYYEYLTLQITTSLNVLSYFENIKKYPAGSFLLGSYNITSIIREHNLHIAIATTKAKLEKNVKMLSKVLYLNTCKLVENKSISIAEEFEYFLTQFKDSNYPDNYYKKFAAVLPVDKLSNELCQIILDKNWPYILASLATFELILSNISTKFNSYAKTILNNPTLLDTSYGNTNCSELLTLLVNEEENDIKSGINDTIAIFVSFFNEINEQFYCD